MRVVGQRSSLAYPGERLNLRHLHGLSRDRQSNHHRSAGADLRLHIHGAVMEVDRAQGERHAQAVAVFLSREIKIENALEILARDAWPGVANGNLDEPALLAERAGEAQGTAVGHRLACVTDDIAQCFGQQRAIDIDRRDINVEMSLDANPRTYDLAGNF